MNQSHDLERAASADRPKPCISRRAWLWGVGCVLGSEAWARGDDRPTKGDRAQIDAIGAGARKAGLGPFRTSFSTHFLAVGDAPDRFRESALGVCEAFAKVFVPYFHERGFETALPKERLAVVALKDADSYRALAADETGEAVGGHYDLDDNRLVIFDFRGQRDQLAATAERVNTFTLVHESAHLLSYNCGLLDRQADVPACVSEGLATYVELWRPRAGVKFGLTNRPRLKALIEAGAGAQPWIPIADLIADDKVFDAEATVQLAYAESWLLIHMLIKTTAKRPALRAYLKSMPAEASEANRVACAEKALGSLADLDHELKRHAKRELDSP